MRVVEVIYWVVLTNVEDIQISKVMKANELMVVDWLKHANGKYYRVTRIDILGDYNSIHYACGFPHLWEYNNKFEPIPLTPDILKKNGFHEVWDEDIKLMVCDTIIVETGDNYKLYKDGKMYLHRVLVPLYYVH